MFIYEVESLIASIKYEIKELELKSKDEKHKQELKQTLKVLNELYETYQNGSELEKQKAYKNLLWYLRTPKLFNLIYKYKRLIASFALIGAILPLSACKKTEKEESATTTIAEVQNNLTVSFVDEEGKIIKNVDVRYGARIPECEAEEKEDYEFLGWYNNNQEYKTWDRVTSDLTLTAKYCGPISSRDSFLSKLNETIADIDGISLSIDNKSMPIITASSITTFTKISQLVSENASLFEDVKVNLLSFVSSNDLTLLDTLPTNLTYSRIYLYEVTEESNLKQMIRDLKVESILLGTGNISEEDLKYILSEKQASFCAFSKDFNKFELINKYAKSNKVGRALEINLNSHANGKKIILPDYDIIFIKGSPDAPDAQVVATSEYSFININYKDSEFLNITCSDNSVVRINIYDNDENREGIPLEPLSFNETLNRLIVSPIYAKLANVKHIEIGISAEKNITIEKKDEQTTVMDENGTLLGEINSVGFKPISKYNSSLTR